MTSTAEPAPAPALEAALALLERIVDDRALLAELDDETRERLLIACGRLVQPDRDAVRRLRKARRRRHRDRRRAIDEQALARTGMREQQRRPVFPTPDPIVALPAPEENIDIIELLEPRKCYTCKVLYTKLHSFYDSLCPECAAFNWHKRNQSADLTGRLALVTGGRVKIGYHAAIKLLRAGAHVVVTTRFPRDAADRYAHEVDFDAWSDRLEIFGLDLRHVPSVEALATHFAEHLPRLDFVINNACQTVRRPPAYYAHLLEGERRTLGKLPQSVLGDAGDTQAVTWRPLTGEASQLWGLHSPAEATQVALINEDQLGSEEVFPSGQLDVDRQQVDLRSINSWRLRLADVSAVEVLEVHLVNAVAPAVLNARLKPLMQRHATFDKHIVNVSAMEGQFYRGLKTDAHPHTNMAKAALNMMTRTSAADYVRDGIHMNSVDTGWITDEDPAHIAERKVKEHGFHPPLDVVDAAARICDPIFAGLLSGEHMWGQFLKDYRPTKW